MNEIRAVVLEDDENVLSSIVEGLRSLSAEVKVTGVPDPGRWHDVIRSSQFDFVVTDMMKGDEEAEMPGDAVVEFIFEHRFVPIVIHSAKPGLRDHFQGMAQHPLVHIQEKSDEGGIALLMKAVSRLLPVASSISRVYRETQQVLQKALTATAIEFRNEDLDWEKQLPHIARRRLAASLDLPFGEAKTIDPVERYIIPPMDQCLVTGDILMRKGSAGHDFRLVLSQSCDLAWTPGDRAPKVKEALVAQTITAEDVDRAFPNLKRGTDGKPKDMKGLVPIAEGGTSSGVFALPHIPGKCNTPLVFGLKSLETIPLVKIEGGEENAPRDAEWRRIASQDSPFREQVVWNFLAVMGRPGLPDVDRDKLLPPIAEVLKVAPKEGVTTPTAPKPPPKTKIPRPNAVRQPAHSASTDGKNAANAAVSTASEVVLGSTANGSMPVGLGDASGPGNQMHSPTKVVPESSGQPSSPAAPLQPLAAKPREEDSTQALHASLNAEFLPPADSPDLTESAAPMTSPPNPHSENGETGAATEAGTSSATGKPRSTE